jgi:hypothetical protein
MPTRTRAEFEHLNANHERLCAELQNLLETMRTLLRDVQIEFQRTASLQANLDEERRSSARTPEDSAHRR